MFDVLFTHCHRFSRRTMSPHQCAVCGGPVAAGSQLERLDVFDLRVADGHLAAAAVQQLRHLDPAAEHRLCRHCAALLARKQRLLNGALRAEAETELDQWVAEVMSGSGETPGGVTRRAVQQSDSVTSSSETQTGGRIGSPPVKEIVSVMAVRSASLTDRTVVEQDNASDTKVAKLRGVTDLATVKSQSLPDLNVIRSETVVAPAAVPSGGVSLSAGPRPATVTGPGSGGVSGPKAARSRAAGTARCRDCRPCARCGDAHNAATTAATLERHLAALAKAAARRSEVGRCHLGRQARRVPAAHFRSVYYYPN